MYTIKLHKKVIKFINSRNSKDKQTIKEKLTLLQTNPYPKSDTLDIKKMKNSHGFRLRIGNYRFLYDVIDEELVIYIENGDNRGDIY